MPEQGQAQAMAWEEIGRLSGALAEGVDDLWRSLPLVASPGAGELAAALGSQDVAEHELALPGGGRLPLIYVQTLVDKQRLWGEVQKPLLTGDLDVGRLPGAERPRDVNQILHLLLRGYVVLLPPGAPPAAVELPGLQQRQVEGPTTEMTLVGPKEGFVENLETDVGLIRNRLRDPRLRVEFHTVGRRSRTRVAMLHLEGVAWGDLVARTREGIGQIAIDHVRTAMDVAELIYSHSWTPFPLVEQTERPDRVAAGLALGRLCLLVEGEPFALMVPVTLFEFQKDTESALQGPLIAFFVRTLRLLGMFLTVAVPGLYATLLSSDVGVLPATLAVTVASGRAGVPYPVLTETLIMIVIVDILAEAISQAASGIGSALGVVGSLIVGQMMVQAQLASPLLMIVVATTMMGAFLTLRYPFSYALRLWKYPVVLLSGFAGLDGWFAGMMLVVVHLASLKSAGVPYLRPLAPLSDRDLMQYGPVQPSRASLRLRPAMWNPVQAIRARRGGRA